MLQATLQEKDTDIQKLEEQISHQKVLIGRQTTDLFKKSELLSQLAILLEQLIKAEEKKKTHKMRMRMNEREVHYLHKYVEELKAIKLTHQKVCLP